MKSITTAIALSSLLIACGSSGEEAETESTMITASEGGSVQLEGTETRLNIPADALTEDTEVSVGMASISDYEDLEGAIDLVVELSPEIVLSSTAILAIDTSDLEIPIDSYLSIRQYTDQTWIQPEVSSAEISSGGIVLANVALLAPTTVVVTNSVPQ